MYIFVRFELVNNDLFCKKSSRNWFSMKGYHKWALILVKKLFNFHQISTFFGCFQSYTFITLVVLLKAILRMSSVHINNTLIDTFGF